MLNPKLNNAVKPLCFLCFDTSNGGGDLFSSFVWYYQGLQSPKVENNYFKLKAYILNATIVKKYKFVQILTNLTWQNHRTEGATEPWAKRTTRVQSLRWRWSENNIHMTSSFFKTTFKWRHHFLKQHSRDVIKCQDFLNIWWCEDFKLNQTLSDWKIVLVFDTSLDCYWIKLLITGFSKVVRKTFTKRVSGSTILWQYSS